MPMRIPSKTPPESICLLRLSAIGDVCNAVPIVRTIQKYWPETEITWIVGKLEHELVGDMRGVRFHVYDKKNRLADLLKIRRTMARQRFAVLLQMQASLRASMVAIQIPADLKVGFHRQQAKDFQWLFTHAKTGPLHHAHVVDVFFAFLETIGLDQREMAWDIPIPDKARSFVADQISAPRGKYLVVSPCSSSRFRNWRNWRVERYAKLIDYAAQKYGIPTVLTGGPTEMETAYGRKILGLCRHKPLNLIGKTTVKELFAVIECAMAVVAPDSGPIHLANALGVPPIGLFASSNPDRTGPYLFRKWVVNAYPSAVERAFGKGVEHLPWGKRVRDPKAIDLIELSAVKEKVDAAVSGTENKSNEVMPKA